MATLLVDESWLINEFGYKEYIGRTPGGGSNLSDSVPVTKCRIDQSPSYERDGTQTVKIGDASIYCYRDFTEGVAMEDLKERSEVIINGKNYVVKRVKIHYEIDRPVINSVQLVVL